MPLTDQDARALTYLARRLRTETHGCREWDDAGTYAKIAGLIGQNLALSMERVLCHATDPEARTPGAIARPFTPPKPSEQSKPRAHPPVKAEECPTHVGQYAGNCGGCRADKLAEPDDEPTAADIAEGARLRAEIRARRERLQAQPEDDAAAKGADPTDEETA
jgi:hypothetical protein